MATHNFTFWPSVFYPPFLVSLEKILIPAHADCPNHDNMVLLPCSSLNWVPRWGNQKHHCHLTFFVALLGTEKNLTMPLVKQNSMMRGRETLFGGPFVALPSVLPLAPSPAARGPSPLCTNANKCYVHMLRWAGDSKAAWNRGMYRVVHQVVHYVLLTWN